MFGQKQDMETNANFNCYLFNFLCIVQ